MKYNPGVRADERIITKALKKYKSKLILDIGCGLGYITEKISQNRKIIGVDLDKKSLKFAQKKTGGKIMFVVANALNLPFKSSSFDGVVASQLIEHMPNDKAFVREVNRIIKLRGIFVITTPSIEGIIKPSAECHGSGPQKHYKLGYTKHGIVSVLGNAFKIEMTKYSMTLFSRMIMDIIKRGYKGKFKYFEAQSDVLKVTNTKLFRLYRIAFFIVIWFIYLDDIISKFIKGSNIMIVARKIK